jgi:predicted methyltransferase
MDEHEEIVESEEFEMLYRSRCGCRCHNGESIALEAVDEVLETIALTLKKLRAIISNRN